MPPHTQPACPQDPDSWVTRRKSTFELEFRKPSFPTENVEEYCEGGFHPIRVDSIFRGRYVIKGKLGFGGSGTVWWARDIVQERHVAIKIMTADASSRLDTLQTFYYFPDTDDVAPNHPGKDHIIQLIGTFWHKGPNGNHLCLVLKLAGPKVEDYVKHRPSGSLSLSEIQTLCLDIARALAYLHINGYVHGDLTPNNVFMAITPPRSWNESQRMVAEGVTKAVSAEPLLRSNGETALPNGPRIITSPIQLWHLDPECLTSKVVIGDLDASFPIEDTPERNFTLPPLHHCAPELLLQAIPTPPSMAADVWSLASTLFVIRTGTLLFPRTRNVNRMFTSMWLRLSDHKALGNLWAAKNEYLDEDGNIMVDSTIHRPLREVIEDVGRDFEVPIGSDSVYSVSVPSEVVSVAPSKSFYEQEWSAIPTSKKEVDMLHDLLSKMLQVDPTKRIKIEKVLEHPWFSAQFESARPDTDTTLPLYQ